MNEINQEINSIINKLKLLVNENTNERGSVKNNQSEFIKIKSIAKKYPIKNHPLNKCDEYVQKGYIKLLISIFNLEEKIYIDRNQILFIARIIEGLENKNINLEELLHNSTIIKEIEICDYINTIEYLKLSDIFVIDSIICSNINGTNISNRVIEYLSVIYNILGIKEEELKEYIGISINLLEGKDEEVINKASALIDLNKFNSYMQNPINGVIVYDLEGLKKCIDKNVFFINGNIKNEKINLDEYSFENLTFINCNFENIDGIYSQSKEITFNKCMFNNNYVPQVKEKTGFWSSNRLEYLEFYVFIEITYANFYDCKFENCNVNKSLIKLKKGNIINTNFYNCNNKLCKNKDTLIEISNGSIKNCNFENCHSETNSNDRNSDTNVNLINLYNSEMKNCNFNECVVHTHTSYGSYATHRPYLIYAKNSKVTNCILKKCSANGYDYDGTCYNSMIVLESSYEKENKFVDCYSEHKVLNLK